MSDIISFVLADLRYTPIRDCCLDAAVSLDTVQNIQGNGLYVEKIIKDYIKESTRIVKPARKVVLGTRYPVPRNKAQGVFMEFRLFKSKLEYVLWETQSRYHFEYELISWFKKSGLRKIEAEIIEHNIPYPTDVRIHANNRINSRLKQIEPYATRVKLEDEFHKLLETLDKYGEEWLPTLIIDGTKVTTGKK